MANRANRQKGLRERLLCSDCEGRINVFEKYVCEVWRTGAGAHLEVKGRKIEWKNLDYARFKLFLMSILWRAGVSSLDFFKDVQLGRRHEEKLRTMILASDPGEPHEYGCIVFPLISDNVPGRLVEVIMNPERMRIQGHTVYRFFFGSVCWLFVVSRHADSLAVRGRMLDKAGTMRGYLVKPEETELFTRLAHALDQQGKLMPSLRI